MGSENARVKLDVSWLVHAVHVAESCGDAKVRRDRGERLLHRPDLRQQTTDETGSERVSPAAPQPK